MFARVFLLLYYKQYSNHYSSIFWNFPREKGASISIPTHLSWKILLGCRNTLVTPTIIDRNTKHDQIETWTKCVVPLAPEPIGPNRHQYIYIYSFTSHNVQNLSELCFNENYCLENCIEVMMDKEIVILHPRRCGNLCSFGILQMRYVFFSRNGHWKRESTFLGIQASGRNPLQYYLASNILKPFSGGIFEDSIQICSICG